MKIMPGLKDSDSSLQMVRSCPDRVIREMDVRYSLARGIGHFSHLHN